MKPRLAVLLSLLGAVALLVFSMLRQAEPAVLLPPTAGASDEVRSRVSYVFGSYHDLEIQGYRLFLQARGPLGGGLELIDESRLLVVTGDGRSLVFSLLEQGTRVETLDIESPLDAATYLNQHPDPRPTWFRVYDTLLESGSSPVRSLFFSFTHWDSENDCYSLRLAEARVDFDAPEETRWTLRYESEPCLELPFLNNGTGGRMAFLGDSSLLMTVGDHASSTPDLMEDPDWSYGKVLRFDRRDWSHDTFTTGHRNPQGLLVSGDEIWETEHGPHGGDELNLLREGEDYGWPTDSYGTDYGKKTLEFAKKTGDHSRGRRPIFSWNPSIAISNLVRLSDKGFPAWEGDLMIGSLIGKGNGDSLFRVRIREGRVVGVEKFKMKQAIRDLLELPDGRLALWNGNGSIQLVSSANHIFASCAACHALRFASHGVGPDLMGVVERDVASHEDFAYSSAMRGFGGRWTRERLDAFLTDPAGTVPGTAMVFEGVPDPHTRTAIIEYLSGLELPQ